MQERTYTTSLECPYDLFGTLRFARMGKTDPTFMLTPDRVERAFWYRGEAVTLSAYIHRRTIQVKATGGDAQLLCEAAPRLLGWAAPNFTVEGHPLLSRLSQRYRGVRRCMTPHLGYDMIQTVMQQLIEWREAANAWRIMVNHLGHTAPGHPHLKIPPSYEEIAKMSLSAFQKMGISMKRGHVIRELGRIGHRLDTWHDEPIDTLRPRLLSIPGIGPWTVDHCLGFSLGAADVVPLGDYQLPHTVCWALADEHRGNDKRMVELLKPWGGNRWSVLRLIFASNLRAPRRGPRIDMGNASRPRF